MKVGGHNRAGCSSGQNRATVTGRETSFVTAMPQRKLSFRSGVNAMPEATIREVGLARCITTLTLMSVWLNPSPNTRARWDKKMPRSWVWPDRGKRAPVERPQRRHQESGIVLAPILKLYYFCDRS